MHVISNSVTPNTVREETRGGDRYLIVEDVPFVRAMNLVGGYVPDDEIRSNTDRWEGKPLTANHPRNEPGKPWYDEDRPDNTPIPITTSEAVQREYAVGEAENPSYDGTWTRVDMAINADVATAMGGHAADIISKIENGEPFGVSSQYVPRTLPAGEYDGQHRANVEGIQRPDSIALLPHKRGQCSRADGCGINPEVAANAVDAEGVRVPIGGSGTDDPTGARPSGSDTSAMHANATADGIEWSGTAGGDLEVSEIPNDDYATHFVFDEETKSDSSFPLVDAEGNLRRENVAAAFRFRDDAPDTEALLDVLSAVNDEFDDPPIDPESLAEARGVSGNSVLSWGYETIQTFLGKAVDDAQTANEPSGNEPAEYGVESSPQDAGTTMERDTLIEEITANSPLTEESLEERCDDGLEAIHEDVMAANDHSGADDDNDDQATNVTNDENYATQDDLDELREEIPSTDEIAEAVAANQADSEKTEMAEEIVANSAEYDDVEEVQEDFPTTASLRTKRDSLTSGAGAVPAGGVVGNADVDDSETDTDDVPAGVFN